MALTKMTKFIRDTKNGPNKNDEIYENDEKFRHLSENLNFVMFVNAFNPGHIS